MKHRLAEKSQLINQLEFELFDFRELCLDLKEKMTMMEGEYEIQVEELEERLNVAKQ